MADKQSNTERRGADRRRTLQVRSLSFAVAAPPHAKASAVGAVTTATSGSTKAFATAQLQLGKATHAAPLSGELKGPGTRHPSASAQSQSRNATMATVGSRQAAGCSAKQLHSWPVFQPLYLMAYRALRDAQLVSGAGEGQVPRCAFERAQAV
jgi:hypothetical protein